MSPDGSTHGIFGFAAKLVAVALICSLVSCKDNTEYSPGFDIEDLGLIESGMTVEEVVVEIGPPFSVYSYPVPRTHAKPERLNFGWYMEHSKEIIDREVDFRYSKQHDPEKHFSYVVVVFRRGVVHTTINTLAGD